MCNVHIEYSTYQFSEESKGGGRNPPPSLVLAVPKKAWIIAKVKIIQVKGFTFNFVPTLDKI